MRPTKTGFAPTLLTSSGRVTDSRAGRALLAVAVVAAIVGCGGEKAGDAAVVARLRQAGFSVACVASGELLRNRSAGPTVRIHVLRRGALVLVTIPADSVEQGRSARAVRVHSVSGCPEYRGTLAQRALGRVVVFAAAAGGLPSRGEVSAAMACAARPPCDLPAPSPPRRPKKRPPRRPPSKFDQAVDALPLHVPPLRPQQVTTFDGDYDKIVVSVPMGRFCAMGIAERRGAVASYAAVVEGRFVAHGVHGVRLVVTIPSETARIRPLARAADGTVTLTARGIRTAGARPSADASSAAPPLSAPRPESAPPALQGRRALPRPADRCPCISRLSERTPPGANTIDHASPRWIRTHSPSNDKCKASRRRRQCCAFAALSTTSLSRSRRRQ